MAGFEPPHLLISEWPFCQLHHNNWCKYVKVLPQVDFNLKIGLCQQYDQFSKSWWSLSPLGTYKHLNGCICNQISYFIFLPSDELTVCPCFECIKCKPIKCYCTDLLSNFRVKITCVTRLGYFWMFMATKFHSKVAQIFAHNFGKWNYLSKNSRSYFWVS